MKNLLIALTIALGSATAASAGALDAYVPEPTNSAAAVDYTATASIGDAGADAFEGRARLGDGSPQFTGNVGGGVDLTATASIGGASADPFDGRARLGDGSPSVN